MKLTKLLSSSGPTITQPGDTWLLGNHRVHCGSALDEQALAQLMEGQKAQAVITDPPYNVRITGNVSGLGRVKHGEFAMASGEMSEAEFTRFLADVFSMLVRYSVDGSLHYIFMDWRHMSEMLEASHAIYSGLINLCVWAKDTPGMGSFYRSQHELVFVFKNRQSRHRNNVQLGSFGRNRSNVWNYPSAHGFASGSDEERNLLALHATPKPVVLIADALLDCTARKDIVLDCFLGSGTTVIAAERTGRRCFGLELEPAYADTIVRRWQRFTRGEARLAESNRSFSEVATERIRTVH